MQRSRRQDPTPWTWEVPAAVVLTIVLVLTAGAQLGRSTANLLSGAGWAWVPSGDLVSSVPGIIGGDAGTGLPVVHHAARAPLLWSCVIIIELAFSVGAGWVLKMAMDQWGPNRLRGMATREEAAQLLGRSHLRAVAPVVRPDLHRGQQRR